MRMAKETAALANVRVARVAKILLLLLFILDSLSSLLLRTADNVVDARESDDGAVMVVGFVENAALPTTSVERGMRLRIFFMLMSIVNAGK